MRFACLLLLFAVAACAGAGRAPVDRCAATTSSLRALEPTCWAEAGAPDAAPPDR